MLTPAAILKTVKPSRVGKMRTLQKKKIYSVDVLQAGFQSMRKFCHLAFGKTCNSVQKVYVAYTSHKL